ncbi:MAG TPA: nickel pincer cofactor biosynthesis protein LarB [Pirellulales bacterium]|nr:nickel pincer cofactor biosynthesis protein LarB [Pirellulales bacterium]
MQLEDLRLLAEQLLAGELSVGEFTDRLSHRPIADVGVAQLDLDRARRCGFPEVVFGQGKSVDALATIFESLLANGVSVLSTRISAEQARELLPRFEGAVYNPLGRTFRIPLDEVPSTDRGHIGIITAGTSDLPVAEEARETANWMGVRVTMIQDVGVAGPHRLPARLPELQAVDAIVVIAGMEGALPSVVGGYVDCPVIAVPTSVGYGANLGGLAALLSMLNSCAANVTVVNIDAGFKGAYVAGLIASKAAQGARSRW